MYLKEVNADYEAKRSHDMLLQMPIIHFVPEGTFHARLKTHNKLGGQAKIPKLSPERCIIDELLQFAI